jgi:hypothetical protein
VWSLSTEQCIDSFDSEEAVSQGIWTMVEDVRHCRHSISPILARGCGRARCADHHPSLIRVGGTCDGRSPDRGQDALLSTETWTVEVSIHARGSSCQPIASLTWSCGIITVKGLLSSCLLASIVAKISAYLGDSLTSTVSMTTVFGKQMRTISRSVVVACGARDDVPSFSLEPLPVFMLQHMPFLSDLCMACRSEKCH